MPAPELRRARGSVRTAAALASLLVLPLSPAARAAEPPPSAGPRVIEIVAQRFRFEPNLVTVRKDEPVLLRLRSQDVVHGFFQRALGIDTTISPDRPTEVALTAHEAGRFVVICHHFCGAGHGNMRMTVVVE